MLCIDRGRARVGAIISFADSFITVIVNACVFVAVTDAVVTAMSDSLQTEYVCFFWSKWEWIHIIWGRIMSHIHHAALLFGFEIGFGSDSGWSRGNYWLFCSLCLQSQPRTTTANPTRSGQFANIYLFLFAFFRCFGIASRANDRAMHRSIANYLFAWLLVSC